MPGVLFEDRWDLSL